MSNINLYINSLDDIIEKIGIERLEKFRKIIVFSHHDLDITFNNDNVTYISIEKMSNILQDYLHLYDKMENLIKKDLPYLFIFNVTIFHKEFLEKSNWVQFRHQFI
jgi:hypothetical protein